MSDKEDKEIDHSDASEIKIIEQELLQIAPELFKDDSRKDKVLALVSRTLIQSHSGPIPHPAFILLDLIPLLIFPK